MASSTTHLDLLSASQAQKEVSANALFDAASAAALFGRRASTTTALTWGYYGGMALIGGTVTSIANGTVALSASTTNYVEVSNTGSVSKNTTGFTAGSTPLYTIVTGASTVTSYTDHRVLAATLNPRAAISLGSDANKTLTQAEAAAEILDCTSSVSLTATRNLVVPLTPRQWTVYNGTTGAQSIQVIGATGTGVTIATGKRAIVYSDGTNVVRATADV